MATTPEGIIPDLLLARMASLPFSPALQTAYPGRTFTPPAGTHLEIQWLPNRTHNVFLSDDDPDMFQGILQITVVARRDDTGIVAPSDIAGAIAADLKGATISGDGLRIKIDDRPSIAGVIQDGDRIRIPVSARYRAFA